MAGNGGYTTAGRRKILEYLKQNGDRTVSAADIDSYLKGQGSGVNITTVYRNLDRLAKDGIVIKYVAEKGGQTTYQYVAQGSRCEEHLHLKCVHCGCIAHLDCAFMDEITGHILNEHDFTLQCRNSVLYGVCGRCRGQGGTVGKE